MTLPFSAVGTIPGKEMCVDCGQISACCEKIFLHIERKNMGRFVIFSENMLDKLV